METRPKRAGLTVHGDPKADSSDQGRGDPVRCVDVGDLRSVRGGWAPIGADFRFDSAALTVGVAVRRGETGQEAVKVPCAAYPWTSRAYVPLAVMLTLVVRLVWG